MKMLLVLLMLVAAPVWAAPSLMVSQTTATPGGIVTVTVNGSSGASNDWVGLFATGAANTAHLDWFYLNGTKKGGPGFNLAVMPFTMPQAEGTYEFRLIRANYGVLYATSPAVTVAKVVVPPLPPPLPSISLPPPSGTGAGRVKGIFETGTDMQAPEVWIMPKAAKGSRFTGFAPGSDARCITNDWIPLTAVTLSCTATFTSP